MSDITANVVIGMPSQLFTMPRSFKAVANGKIYIGQIDTDPVNPANQIPVYLENEDGSHVQVAQPIVINVGGYPVYNGQIAKFVTVQGHSMAVYDAYGTQQFYYPNVLKYDPDQLRQELSSYGNGLGDALVAVKYPSTSSSDRTQHEKNTDYLSVSDFVIHGEDPEADKTYAFQNAHDALSENGGVVHIPNKNDGFWTVEGIVNISKPITFTGSGSSPTTLVKKSSTSSTFFNIAEESCSIQNIRMIGTSTSSGFAITTENNSSRLYLNNLQIRNGHSGIKFKSNLFSMSNVEIIDIRPNEGVGVEVDQSGVNDGVGIIESSIVQNSDDNEPYAGILLTHAIGILIDGSQLMQCGKSISIQPPSLKGVSSVKIINCYLDSSNDAGLYISNDGGGNVSRITIADSWLASSKNGSGLSVATKSVIDGLRVSSCEFYDNINGISIGDDCQIQNLDIDFGVFAGNKTTDLSIGKNNSNFFIVNCRSGVSGGFGESPFGLYVNSGCSHYTVNSNRFHKINDESYPASGVCMVGNYNYGTGFTSFTPAPMTDTTGQTSTVLCNGARIGDIVNVSFDKPLQGVILTGWVSSNDTVSFRMQNGTGSSITLPAGNISAAISRYS